MAAGDSAGAWREADLSGLAEVSGKLEHNIYHIANNIKTVTETRLHGGGGFPHENRNGVEAGTGDWSGPYYQETPCDRHRLPGAPGGQRREKVGLLERAQ